MTPQEASNSSRKTTSSWCWRSSSTSTAWPRPRPCRSHHFEDILNDGAGFAGFAVWGLGQEPHDPDYMAVGDLSTLSLVPWQPGYARIVCNGRVKQKPWPFDTRYILQQQLARLAERGWTMNTGLEPEFMLISRQPDGTFGPADASDALEKPCYDYKGLSRSRAFLERLVESLLAVGIDVYQIDHEDANGQFEINFTFADALTTADRMVLFPHGGRRNRPRPGHHLHLHAQAALHADRQRHAHAPVAGRQAEPQPVSR